MEHIVKNMVIWIFLSAIEVVHAMSRDDLNRFTFPRKDMGHCKLKKDEKYSCWIGKSMLLRENEFYRMLKLKATSGNLVILSFTDFSYVEMAVNLHESLQSQNISNSIFICADEKALKVLRRRGIASFLYQHLDINSDEAPKFYSDDFRIKTSIKIKIITAALMLGFQVIFTDVDVVFLRNPIHYLTSYKRADLVIQKDSDYDLNSGFLLARPTYSGVTLMLRTLDVVMERIIIDQEALNLVIEEMITAKTLNVVVLDPKKFPCGKVYFEDEKRMFLEDRKHNDLAYIVHNNFLHTKVAINN